MSTVRSERKYIFRTGALDVILDENRSVEFLLLFRSFRVPQGRCMGDDLECSIDAETVQRSNFLRRNGFCTTSFVGYRKRSLALKSSELPFSVLLVFCFFLLLLFIFNHFLSPV
eukprot:Gb_15926 [translate_table: standard]